MRETFHRGTLCPFFERIGQCKILTTLRRSDGVAVFSLKNAVLQEIPPQRGADAFACENRDWVKVRFVYSKTRRGRKL